MTPLNQPYQAILFDFDGTLLDSFPAHYRAYEVMLAHFDMALSPDYFKQIYSPNWFAMYEALNIPRERWAEADEVWLAEASTHQPQLFAEARPLLEELRKAYLLGLVTAGNKERVLRDLARVGIAEFFQVVVTGDDVTTPKPDPDGLLIALEHLGIQPADALYVGDAREDCWMAQAAAVPFIGIAGEFGTVGDAQDCAQMADLADLGPTLNKTS